MAFPSASLCGARFVHVATQAQGVGDAPVVAWPKTSVAPLLSGGAGADLRSCAPLSPLSGLLTLFPGKFQSRTSALMAAGKMPRK